jgi:tRNA threonylcarbamoyladenosine biosynthesis protein TsaB
VDAIELMSPDEVRSPVEFYYLVGNAVIAYPQEMLKVSEQARAVLSSAVPHARSLAELAKSGRYPRVKPEHLQPLYVRDKVAQTIAERQAGV